MKRVTRSKTVYVAMSGGVDSSVAAYILKQRGFNVVGVFMRPWQPVGFRCAWEQDRSDALRVATNLDIPFETWDFSKQYERLVSRPMVAGYRRGTTPNPDVECNRHIKFGYFFKEARRRGADFIATGHYARTKTSKGRTYLVKARDSSKDQTYFLWGLTEDQLRKTLFPLGDLLKSRVRETARQAGLHVATKKDSQGVCFIGQLDMKSFLQTRVTAKQGRIVHVDGRVIGTHDGVYYYTIGQRHGLDIKDGGGPYFVVKKSISSNTIYVGSRRDLMCSSARIKKLHWITEDEKMPTSYQAKIRYRTTSVPVKLNGTSISFSKPVAAVTPGQSIVLYRGSRVYGGAILR